MHTQLIVLLLVSLFALPASAQTTITDFTSGAQTAAGWNSRLDEIETAIDGVLTPLGGTTFTDAVTGASTGKMILTGTGGLEVGGDVISDLSDVSLTGPLRSDLVPDDSARVGVPLVSGGASADPSYTFVNPTHYVTVFDDFQSCAGTVNGASYHFFGDTYWVGRKGTTFYGEPFSFTTYVGPEAVCALRALAGDVVRMTKSHSLYVPFGEPSIYEARVALPTLSTGGETYRAAVGLFVYDENINAFSIGAGFVYDSAISLNWLWRQCAASVCTDTDLGEPVSVNFVRLRVDSDGTNLSVKIDGAEKHTLLESSLSDTGVRLYASVQTTAGTNNPRLNLEYIWYSSERP